MSFERRGSNDTGRTFESRLFGTAQMDPQFLFDLDKIEKDERGRFRSVGQVYEAFKRNYRGAGVGERGETSLSTDLRQEVEDALGFEDQSDELKFYSTVGTVIDHKLGVDAFFELKDPKTGAYARVTLDATLNKEKQREGWKADVIVGELPDAVQEEKAYDKEKAEIGGRIAEMLQKRLNEQIERRGGRRAA
ncbi:MAG TPA: hypothetical protein VL283_00550 [Candidatus Baltobacteraceae bacterium]|jgi:hypothetical protein|nr:hypothetical protein [Candidatus Baltobacteraceae bacterium]